MNFSTTIVLPIKGESDVKRFNHILRPSLDSIRNCKLLIVTDEKIDPLPTSCLPVRVVSDSEFDLPKMGGWHKQQAIKLLSHAFVDTEWILTMDSDCFFMFSGGIEMLMPNGKPFCNTTKHKSNQDNWWNHSSKLLSSPIPDVRCTVTPMFLKADSCKDLTSKIDVAQAIKHGCNEYALYWINLNRPELYTHEPLVIHGNAYWNKGDPISFAKKTFGTAGRMGLIQSTAEKHDENLLDRLIDIYEKRILNNRRMH